MLDHTKDARRPLRVLFIDNTFLQRIDWTRKFAESTSAFEIILLSDELPSRKDRTLEVINVHDVRQNLELAELETRLNFPIYRALVTERAYFDYSTFARSECYSRASLDQIGKLIRPYANALDEIIRTRADLVMGHLSDNAIVSLAAHIASSYGVPYAAPYPYYWWPDGILFVDRPDETSSDVDRLYRQYYANQDSIDRAAINKLYAEKRALYQFSDIAAYPLLTRLKNAFLSSRYGHDPFSPSNWVVRRFRHLLSQLLIPRLTRRLSDMPAGKRYVLFPMHVAPEASLLGTTPELADQFSLIKNISMNLPWDVRLCVKLHPGQHNWSGPSLDFYCKLAALKNLDVIDAGVSLDRILRDENCIAVAAINSTVGIDAALLRKPVFVFGHAIYSVADCFLKPKSFDEFREQIRAIQRGEFQFDDGALASILAAMDAAVCRGDNDFWLAKTLEEARLRSFSAFERYIRSETWRKSAHRTMMQETPLPREENYIRR